MKVFPLSLEGVKLIQPDVFRDERGFFIETYRHDRYKASGIPDVFVQDNHSRSQKHTLRGLHYQSYPGQAKLVHVAEGEIFDVVVDIRPDSPTFGQWESVLLSSDNFTQLYVPIGFAHGFCVLSDRAQVLYKVSSNYNAATEKGFRWDDPTVGVEWPTNEPVLSARDEMSPYFSEIDFVKEREDTCVSSC